MKTHDPRTLIGVPMAALLVLLAGCGGGSGTSDGPPSPSPATGSEGATVVQPGAPGTPSRDISAEDLTATPEHPHTDADVRFMQNMIHHHAQALEMSRMAPERTDNAQILLLARRIDRSQEDEVRLMSRWLRVRGEEVPGAGEMDPGAMGHGAPSIDEPMMAGMLTREQMDMLSASQDEEFDRRFLQAMIYHHEGALDMVSELFASSGAAQGTEINQFALHVDSDQRVEIARMYRILAALD